MDHKVTLEIMGKLAKQWNDERPVLFWAHIKEDKSGLYVECCKCGERSYIVKPEHMMEIIECNWGN